MPHRTTKDLLLWIDIEYRMSEHTRSVHMQMMRVNNLAAEVGPGYKQIVRYHGRLLCG